MTNNELLSKMTDLYNNEQMPKRKMIAMAVQLGMDYRESQIKEGIGIVFSEIHKSDINKA